MLFYVIAILVIMTDQLSKYLIRTYIDIDETFTLWGIQLTHIENSGMAGVYFRAMDDSSELWLCCS